MTASRPGPRAPRPTFPTRVARLLALLVLAGIAPVVSADVYRWVDASGQVHYSETPPVGIRYEVIRSPTPASAAQPPSATASQGRAPAAAAPARPEPTRAGTTAATTADDQVCVDALYQVALLGEERRAFRLGPGGARSYLEDAARPAELERLRRQRDLNCSDDPATRKSQERRAAELAVALSPGCQTSRGKLELMLDPQTRTPESDIERQREHLRTHCPGEDRPDLWLADWVVIRRHR